MSKRAGTTTIGGVLHEMSLQLSHKVNYRMFLNERISQTAQISGMHLMDLLHVADEQAVKASNHMRQEEYLSTDWGDGFYFETYMRYRKEPLPKEISEYFKAIPNSAVSIHKVVEVVPMSHAVLSDRVFARGKEFRVRYTGAVREAEYWPYLAGRLLLIEGEYQLSKGSFPMTEHMVLNILKEVDFFTEQELANPNLANEDPTRRAMIARGRAMEDAIPELIVFNLMRSLAEQRRSELLRSFQRFAFELSEPAGHYASLLDLAADFTADTWTRSWVWQDASSGDSLIAAVVEVRDGFVTLFVREPARSTILLARMREIFGTRLGPGS